MQLLELVGMAWGLNLHLLFFYQVLPLQKCKLDPLNDVHIL